MIAFVLPRPDTSQPHYGRHLDDVGYWRPYVHDALDRHGFPLCPLEQPFAGSFPTFVSGDVVVKLFGDLLDGAASCAAEKAMGELLAGVRDIPAPRLLASGRLYDVGWEWPYLITERAAGTAVREWDVVPQGVPERLGRAVARLHTLPAPDAVADRDLLPRLRSEAVDRLRGFGLPERLLAQVPEFLADASEERVLVHADLTADHLFVDSRGLRSIIDWGDALCADPWYELVAVCFDGLRGDRGMFRRFLEAAAWQCDGDFARRALQGVLEFQFDAVGGISRLVDLDRVETLQGLAERLFTV